MDAKEEVRARLDIADVIGEYVKLQRAGRSYKGLSPFTQEKSPSFFVSPEKQIWHCFSTNKGGDVFSFIMEVEGVDFRGALELLARKAGVELEKYQGADSGKGKRREQIYDLLSLAVRYFQQAMVRSPEAIDYIFKQRHLSKETVQAFGIGYAPDSYDGLTKLLLKRGYAEKDLIDAGLSAYRRGRLGDLFRGRMMLPLRDPQGRTLGFTGRLMVQAKNAPKYLNTPQTILYDKSRHVYGLELAKEAIRTNDFAVLVEGNVDVASSHQAGVQQVVATAGTALTEAHLKTISRFSPNIRLCFDSDKAGIAATERAIPIAQAVGAKLSIITLPDEAKDPDELARFDPARWRSLIDQPKDIVEWIIEQYMKRSDPGTAEGKSLISSKALSVISMINDPVSVEHYVSYLSQRIGTSEYALQQKLRQAGQAPQETELKPTSATPSGPDEHAYQDLFLGINAAYPTARTSLKGVDVKMLLGEQRQRMFTYLSSHIEAEVTESVPTELHQDETYVKIILFTVEQRYIRESWTSETIVRDALSLATRIRSDNLKRKRKQLSEAIQDAYRREDHEALERLTKEYQSLIHTKENIS